MKSLMPVFSFRFKLLLAMMIVIIGATGITLFVSQQRMQVAYQRLFTERFRGQIMVFTSMQEARLAAVKSKCLELASSVRVRAALEEGEATLLYQTAGNELNLRENAVGSMRQRRGGAPGPGLRMIRFLDASGKELPPPTTAGQLLPRNRAKNQFDKLEIILKGGPVQQIGYIPAEKAGLGANLPEGVKKKPNAIPRPELLEVIVTKVVQDDGELLGALAVGFPFANTSEKSLNDYSQIKSGIWLNDTMYSQSLRADDEKEITRHMQALLRGHEDKTEGTFDIDVGGIPHQVFFHLLNKDSSFPPTYQVALYSMAEAIQDQLDLRWRIIAFGSLVLLGGLLISVILSHGFSAPIHDLVAGTSEIQKGNFEVRVPVRSRDEVGRLTQSFNEMAAELALKEKYRSVLNMVADKEVAQQMVHGQMALGGEKREISVLFCDIRGFTAMTQGMDPAEVIQMLNEHMTALTNVVYEHDGVVDKFVGDLIMAVFGAPKSYGNDAYNATRCAVRMIEERNKLNETSRHKIQMGIGIATGEAVAGCMGSKDRQNYTVLGERVNLASRLCSAAGRMDVVIDEATRNKLNDLLEAEEMPALQLKGFTGTMRAFKLTAVHSIKTET